MKQRCLTSALLLAAMASVPSNAAPDRKRRPALQFKYRARTAVERNQVTLPLCDERTDYPVPDDGSLWVAIDPDSLNVQGDIWPIESRDESHIVARRAGSAKTTTIRISFGKPRIMEVLTELRDEKGLVCAVKQWFGRR